MEAVIGTKSAKSKSKKNLSLAPKGALDKEEATTSDGGNEGGEGEDPEEELEEEEEEGVASQKHVRNTRTIRCILTLSQRRSGALTNSGSRHQGWLESW